MDPFEAIKATFFQECDELLADFEAGLLELEAGRGDLETVNAVFRAVHSVKGGAGAFGLEPLVRFAHVLETTLDEVRTGRLAADQRVIKPLLRAADLLADHVQAAKGQGSVDEGAALASIEELNALSHDPAAPVAAVEEEDDDPFGFTPLMAAPPIDLGPPPASGWIIQLRPLPAMYEKANDVTPLLRELARLGPCETFCDADELPTLDLLEPELGYLAWRVRLDSDCEEQLVREVFDFVESDCELDIQRQAGADAGLIDADDAADFAPSDELPMDIQAILGRALASAAEMPSADEIEVQPDFTPMPAASPVEAVSAPDAPAAAAQGGAKSESAPAGATIRVDLERVDRLIDLVGELVINQAMLAQRVVESGLTRNSSIAFGLDDLEQLSREIQDSVMAIRAQPVKSVFQRMPRLVREVGSQTGKPVRLVTEGEATEVDKTVIERLTDPITHMIRNAIDHGLEKPEVRKAAGKPAEGTVRLAALHRSGRVIIEVSDDGGGINRDRVRSIAVDRGLISAEAVLTDDETDNLIFLPGFSTAATVSDISGRGVGMDVVRRSVQALGGRISIASEPGKGSTFTMSLPLTLAVLDGMVVSVGDQTLVTPLTSIIETLRPKPDEVRRLGPEGMVLSVRGAHVPLIDVGVALNWRTQPIDASTGVVLLVESEVGGRSALLVDDIQGQRQVVIKSLEANYQHVEGIAAATILGDGRVALILDVEAVIAGRRALPQPVDFGPRLARAS